MKTAERLLNQMLIEFERRDRGGLYGFTQKRMAYNSNKIEGSTLTEDQTADIFESGMLSGEGTFFRTKDIEEMSGHFLMFNHMLQTIRQPLSQNLIKEFHLKLKAGVFEDMANGYPVGEYKNRKNTVGNITTALPEEVSDRMTQLLAEYHEKGDITLNDIAGFHAGFERIHPFQDGNGRVGRMIVFRECLYHLIMPVLICDKDRFEYYKGLQDVSSGRGTDRLCLVFQKAQAEYEAEAVGFLPPV
ncbi:MAG: Fic family protein [Lachnospiraceae bacterium]|nr:Fic family protein [Lachnospiraceae bacterium]